MARELALVAALVAGCAGDRQQADPGSAKAMASTGDRAAPAATAPTFRVDIAPPAACTRGTVCEAGLVLVALGGYKVNEEYPFKFVGDAQPGLAFEGTGTFARGDAKTGTLTIRFRPDAAGTAKVTGTFKLSVCTTEICAIEAAQVAFEVPVS